MTSSCSSAVCARVAGGREARRELEDAVVKVVAALGEV